MASQQDVVLALHQLDMAAMMGGSLFRPEVDQLTSLAQLLHQDSITTGDVPPNKRQKVNNIQDSGIHVSMFVQPQHAEQQAHPGAEVLEPDVSLLLPPGSLQSHSTAVPHEDMPSLERYKLRQQTLLLSMHSTWRQLQE